MLNSNLFTKWLDHKADLIASKVDREQITTEEMIVLSLQHMDLTYRLEFSKIEKQFKEVDKRFEEVHKKFDEVDKRFEQVDKRFEQVDKRFEQVDKRFDRLERLGTWAFALLFTGILGILLKLKWATNWSFKEIKLKSFNEKNYFISIKYWIRN